MPRPSNEVLMKRLGECATDLAAVSRDDAYSGQNTVLTHKALPVFLRREAESARFVLVLRIDNYSAYRQKYGYDMLCGAIRRVVNVRAPQVLLRSRVPAENEILFVLSEKPHGLMDKLIPIARTEGLEIFMKSVQYSGNIEYDVKRVVEFLELVPARS